MEQISDDERRHRLAARHALCPARRVASVDGAIESVVALHSSDPTSVFLSAAARMTSAAPDDIDHALYEARVAVRHHAMRRTIWVMTPDVARSAHAGFTRKIAAAERRRTTTLFAEDAAWVADGIERVVAAVAAASGPVSAREVGRALPDLAEPRVVNRGKPYQGTMAPHTRLLLCAAFEGRVARGRPAGSWIGSQYAWQPSEDWHGIDWGEPDELAGATHVIGRYLDRFGPATVDDVVWWTGSTKTLVRQALERLAVLEVGLEDGSTGYVMPDGIGEHDDHGGGPGHWVALLPGLDPTAMGWKHRAWYLGPEIAGRVTDRNGNIGPTVWADGRVIGGWVQRPDGAIAHDATRLTTPHRELLADEIARLQAFVGDTRFSVRFPAPNQADLLA